MRATKLRLDRSWPPFHPRKRKLNCGPRRRRSSRPNRRWRKRSRSSPRERADLDFTRTDYERGKILIEHGNIPQQVVDQRRNKFEAAEAAYVAANAQRDQADAAIKAAEADVE